MSIYAELDRKILAGLARLVLSLGLGGCLGPADNTDWPLLGNTAEMQHHAPLDQINRDTVARLGLAWSAEMPTSYGLVGNPLIQHGTVFQGGPGGQIFASDIRTGQLKWHFAATYDPVSGESQSLAGMWGRQMNRGLALYKDMAIIATGDCRLVAVDQHTGKKRWEAQSCDASQMYGISGAPRVGDGLVFIGNACMDTGATRGFVDAFDAETGLRKWRFYTVPGDPATERDPFYQKVAKSWGTDWYKKTQGCGSVWDAITFDEKLHQVYIGVGGPAPTNPSQRAADAGDELFSNSVVALDSRTGAYKWHFKEVPNDGWNFEPSVGIMIADLPVAGSPRRTVVSVPKNGFAYVLDAQTGKFLSGNNYVFVNWASGLKPDGQPIMADAGAFWKFPGKKMLVYPGGMGAHGWEALAFDPARNVLYIPAMIIPFLTTKMPDAKIGGVSFDLFAGERADAPIKSHGEVVAFDLVANKVLWRARDRMPVNGGLLHTSGGLVFQGMADGRLVARDDRTGKVLWSHQTGGAIRAAPSVVMVDGEEYVIVSTGNGASSSTAALVARYTSTPEARTPPRLLAFRLGGKAPYPALAHVEPVPAPAQPRQDVAMAKHGADLFEGYGCSLCHGSDGGASVGGGVPNLNRIPPPDFVTFSKVVQQGLLSSAGMPRFRDMTDADARAIYANIINKAWDAHDIGAKESEDKRGNM